MDLSLANFQQLLNTPNILDQRLRSVFAGNPLLIVAAGPSVQKRLRISVTSKKMAWRISFLLVPGINPLLNAGDSPGRGLYL